jgi:hypothetical protein
MSTIENLFKLTQHITDIMCFQMIKKNNRSSCKIFQGCMSKVIFGPFFKKAERKFKRTVTQNANNDVQFTKSNSCKMREREIGCS